MNLLRIIFKSLFVKRDVKLLFTFTFIPLVSIFLGGSGVNSLNYFDNGYLFFLVQITTTQYKIVLPMLLMILLVSSIFREEIETGTLFLYKDLNRTRLFNAKLLSVFLLYFVFLLVTGIISLITYIFQVITLETPFSFMPLALEDSRVTIYSLIAIILINLITISFVSMVSITSNTMKTVLFGIFFNLFVSVSPLLVGVHYLFPNGYEELSQSNFSLAVLIAFVIAVVYLMITYSIGCRRFKKVEF